MNRMKIRYSKKMGTIRIPINERECFYFGSGLYYYNTWDIETNDIYLDDNYKSFSVPSQMLSNLFDRVFSEDILKVDWESIKDINYLTKFEKRGESGALILY